MARRLNNLNFSFFIFHFSISRPTVDWPRRCRSHPINFLLALSALTLPAFAADLHVLRPASFAHYVAFFNRMEDENVTNFVSNAHSWDWLQRNIPFFECPDQSAEEIYYFRWWSLRKHLCQTTNGFVFTEFLTRPTPISSALGHHLMEGRWLRDQRCLDDYAR